MQPSKMVAFYAENATIVDGIKCKVAFYAEDANISLHCILCRRCIDGKGNGKPMDAQPTGRNQVFFSFLKKFIFRQDLEKSKP